MKPRDKDWIKLERKVGSILKKSGYSLFDFVCVLYPRADFRTVAFHGPSGESYYYHSYPCQKCHQRFIDEGRDMRICEPCWWEEKRSEESEEIKKEILLKAKIEREFGYTKGMKLVRNGLGRKIGKNQPNMRVRE